MYSLADAILKKDIESVRQLARYRSEINELDEYGFTPLIETAIIDNLEIAEILLANGANPNFQDVAGGTPLHWAAENNNLDLCRLLLSKGANPNAYNLAGQPVLVMPTLRRQIDLKRLLTQAGADQTFADDYINTKLLGHMFELVGMVDIVDTQNQYVDVDFEGFYLEVTVGLIADSLAHFQNHFAARKLRRYAGLSQFIVDVMQRASRLIQFQQYRVDISQHSQEIESLIQQEPCLIPIGYEGHAITFIRYGDLWVKCDRREDSRLYDNIMIYRVTKKENLSTDFVKHLLYVKKSDEFVNQEIDDFLGLVPVTEIKVNAQISGNCSWANTEAVIPAIFFLLLMQLHQQSHSEAYYKNLAVDYFNRWREWNKDRALHLCIQAYKQGDALRKAAKAEILAAILFQTCKPSQAIDKNRIESIMAVLKDSPYEYILKNYLKIYYYESNTEEGRQFADLMREYGLIE